MNSPLHFELADANWRLEFGRDAMRTMLSYAQTNRWSRESVGQLYTRDLSQPIIVVEHATWLQPKSSSWSRVRFDPQKAFAERQVLFQSGLHCIGIWHTHPESNPTPSGEDVRLSKDYALAASSQLRGIVFLIVGTRPYPDGFRVWIDDGIELRVANPVSSADSWKDD